MFTVLKLMSVCLLLSYSTIVAADDTPVNNPNIAMQLNWEISSWQALWHTETFQSDAVGARVGYYLYLPPAYQANPETRYPLLVWLHGAKGRAYQAGAVVERLDSAIRKGKVLPMIVVSVLDPTGLSMWTESKDGRLPMETLIIKELLPHIEKNYRTRANREDRAIEGFSMGGYGAAYLGFKYQEIFSSVSMLAAALHTPQTLEKRRKAIFENVFGGDIDYANERSPWTLLNSNADQIRKNTNIRVFIGANDKLLQWNKNFRDLLVDNNINHQWGVVPNAPHDIELIMQNWVGDFFSYYNELFSEH